MITNTQKTLSILQLCAAFSLFLCFLSDPFLGEHYRIKKDLVLIENITGQIKEASSNKSRYERLDSGIKENISQSKNALISKLEQSFTYKFERGLYNLLVKTSPFALAWIFFTVLISIFCLKEKEGSFAASAILPLIVLLYGFDIATSPSISSSISDLKFPSEELLVHQYIKEPIAKDSLELQIQKLTSAFDFWLIETWGKEIPAKEGNLFKEQKENASFLFNLALYKERVLEKFTDKKSKESALLYLSCLLWNILYAVIMNRQLGKDLYQQNSLRKRLAKSS